MTKLIPLSRAIASATALLGACLLVFACPAAAFESASKGPGGENVPLNRAPPRPPPGIRPAAVARASCAR